MFGSKLNADQLTSKLFYQNKGQMIVSALFGLALAMLFQRVCKDRKCIVITAPATADIANKVYQFEGECFKYTPYGVKCPAQDTELVKSSV
jgi:hypothetical protein